MSILLSIAEYVAAWYRKNDANFSFFLNFLYATSEAMIKNSLPHIFLYL